MIFNCDGFLFKKNCDGFYQGVTKRPLSAIRYIGTNSLLTRYMLFFSSLSFLGQPSTNIKLLGVGMKLVRIVFVRPDHFADLDSFGQNYPEILRFGNEFGFFFSETKTNTVRVLSVGIGKRSETIRNFVRISADIE